MRVIQHKLGKNQQKVFEKLQRLNMDLILCSDEKMHEDFLKFFNEELEKLKGMIKNCAYVEIYYENNPDNLSYVTTLFFMNSDKKIEKKIYLF